MNTIAWAIIVTAILTSDVAYSYKFGQEYSGAGLIFCVFALSIIMTIVSTFRP